MRSGLFLVAALTLSASPPALAEESVVEGRLAWVEFTANEGLNFEMEGSPTLCAHGHKGLHPVRLGALRPHLEKQPVVPEHLVSAMLEAKLRGRNVRIRTEPRTWNAQRYCRLLSVTFL